MRKDGKSQEIDYLILKRKFNRMLEKNGVNPVHFSTGPLKCSADLEEKLRKGLYRRNKLFLL